jgi:DNA-binding transcriptional regulator YhcF (GntR family)
MPRGILYGYQTVAQYYTALIFSGSIKEGEHMPSVRAAAADWGIAPMTVLRAYWSMRDAGLLVIHTGKYGGAVVTTRPNKPAPVNDLEPAAG